MSKKPHRILWQILPQDGVMPWKLVKDGGPDNRSFMTQKEAIAEAHRLAEFYWDTGSTPSEIQIHNARGMIRAKDTFPRSTDPSDTPG